MKQHIAYTTLGKSSLLVIAVALSLGHMKTTAVLISFHKVKVLNDNDHLITSSLKFCPIGN